MRVRGTVWLTVLALMAAPAANALAQATPPAPGATPTAQPKPPPPKPPVGPPSRPAGEVAGPPTSTTAQPAPAAPPTAVAPTPRPAAFPPTTAPHVVAPPKPAAPHTTKPVAAAAHPTSAPAATAEKPVEATAAKDAGGHSGKQLDFMTMLFVFMLATFIGIGVIRRVSRLLHTPLMSLTNASSAIAVVGAIIVAGGNKEYPLFIRILGAVALFASMTNIVSGFLITDRMLKMFKTREGGKS